MPAKPAWYGRLPRVLDELRTFPRPVIDRATVESLLQVGRRRAQQIMAPCVTEHVGANGLADRDQLITHLLRLAEGDEAYFEVRRRRKVAEVLDRLRRNRMEQPQLFVEAPAAIVRQELRDLPAGVHLEAGRITVEFTEPQEALEKLLALAMAIGNDFECFDRRTRA